MTDPIREVEETQELRAHAPDARQGPGFWNRVGTGFRRMFGPTRHRRAGEGFPAPEFNEAETPSITETEADEVVAAVAAIPPIVPLPEPSTLHTPIELDPERDEAVAAACLQNLPITFGGYRLIRLTTNSRTNQVLFVYKNGFSGTFVANARGVRTRVEIELNRNA